MVVKSDRDLTVHRTCFKGPLPARASVGAGALLGGAHFEVMGVAVKARTDEARGAERR